MADDRLNSALGAAPMTAQSAPGRDRLLTPGEVATLFRVDPKTVTRWASAGRIGSIRTPGGHRRFRESEVRALLRGAADAPADVTVPVQTTPATAPLANRPYVR
jgi:excisionase family DNA binding protein